MNERYLELKAMADRIDQMRLELWQSEEHAQCVGDEEEKRYVNEKLFSIQSQLRDIAEYCLLGIV